MAKTNATKTLRPEVKALIDEAVARINEDLDNGNLEFDIPLDALNASVGARLDAIESKIEWLTKQAGSNKPAKRLKAEAKREKTKSGTQEVPVGRIDPLA